MACIYAEKEILTTPTWNSMTCEYKQKTANKKTNFLFKLKEVKTLLIWTKSKHPVYKCEFELNA